jgi:hypothetical protein
MKTKEEEEEEVTVELLTFKMGVGEIDGVVVHRRCQPSL